MTAESLLARLEGVRTNGPGRWVARCPAHRDRSPSLSVAEKEGRVLLHCFAGCGAIDVLEAVGMSWSDVMPERVGEFRPERQAFPAAQLLSTAAHEITVAAMLADELGHEKANARLILAAARLNAALAAAGIQPDAELRKLRRGDA